MDGCSCGLIISAEIDSLTLICGWIFIGVNLQSGKLWCRVIISGEDQQKVKLMFLYYNISHVCDRMWNMLSLCVGRHDDLTHDTFKWTETCLQPTLKHIRSLYCKQPLVDPQLTAVGPLSEQNPAFTCCVPESVSAVLPMCSHLMTPHIIYICVLYAETASGSANSWLLSATNRSFIYSNIKLLYVHHHEKWDIEKTLNLRLSQYRSLQLLHTAGSSVWGHSVPVHVVRVLQGPIGRQEQV